MLILFLASSTAEGKRSGGAENSIAALAGKRGRTLQSRMNRPRTNSGRRPPMRAPPAVNDKAEEENAAGESVQSSEESAMEAVNTSTDASKKEDKKDGGDAKGSDSDSDIQELATVFNKRASRDVAAAPLVDTQTDGNSTLCGCLLSHSRVEQMRSRLHGCWVPH